MGIITIPVVDDYH